MSDSPLGAEEKTRDVGNMWLFPLKIFVGEKQRMKNS